jgi:hypothetical protein
MKGGTVRNSPHDKFQHEPGPWYDPACSIPISNNVSKLSYCNQVFFRG